MSRIHVRSMPWGIHILLEGEPTEEQRAAFLATLNERCVARAGSGEPWVSVVEIRNYTRSQQLSENVKVAMQLARACGHVRCAFLVDDWMLARELADAVLKAGSDDQVRIFLPTPQTGTEGASVSAWSSAEEWVFRDLSAGRWSLVA